MVGLLGITFEGFVFIEALNHLYLVDAIGLGGSRELGLFEFEYLTVEVVAHGDDVGFS